MTAVHTLWVVCPVYFDVDAFLVLREHVRAEMAHVGPERPRRTRFVLVDDTGGQDPHLARATALEDVTPIVVPFNLGHQGALVFALRRLSSTFRPDDWIVTMDADGEDLPSDLPRLLNALAAQRSSMNHVVLAWRMKRQESRAFKVGYLLFKLLFRLLTGTVTRTGNFAAFYGRLAQSVLFHPYFDLSYSSALVALNIPATMVPCDRGVRYAGTSKMSPSKLMMHGLRMLTPFVERVAVRAFAAFGLISAGGLVATLLLLVDWLMRFWELPGWMLQVALAAVSISITGLANLIVLFVVFVQFRSLSFRRLHAEGGPASTDGSTTVQGDAC